MADKAQGPTARKAPDPTVTGRRGAASEYPEGTHPPVSPADVTWGADRFNVAEMKAEDKPDETSIVQTVEDPLAAKNEKAGQVSAAEADAAMKANRTP